MRVKPATSWTNLPRPPVHFHARVPVEWKTWLLLPIGPSLETDVLRLTNNRKRCYKLGNDLMFTLKCNA